MKKKLLIFAMLLSAVLCVSFAGCNVEKSDKKSNNQNVEQEQDGKVVNEEEDKIEVVTYQSLLNTDLRLDIDENNNIKFYGNNFDEYGIETIISTKENTDVKNLKFSDIENEIKFLGEKLWYEDVSDDFNFKFVKKENYILISNMGMFVKNGFIPNENQLYGSFSYSKIVGNKYDAVIKKDSKIENKMEYFVYYIGNNEFTEAFDLNSAVPAIDTSKKGLQIVKLSNGDIEVDAEIYVYDGFDKNVDFQFPYDTFYSTLVDYVPVGTTLSEYIKYANIHWKTKDDTKLTEDMVSGFDSTKAGKINIVISCEGISKNLEITIFDPEVEKYNEIRFGENYENKLYKIFYVKSSDDSVATLKNNLLKEDIEICEPMVPRAPRNCRNIENTSEFEIENFDKDKIGFQMVTLVCENVKTKIGVYVYDEKNVPIEKIDCSEVIIKIANEKMIVSGKIKIIKANGESSFVDATIDNIDDVDLEILKLTKIAYLNYKIGDMTYGSTISLTE